MVSIFSLRSQSSRTIVVGTETLQPVESVHNIGIYLDSNLSMQTHVVKVTQTCFFQPRHLRRIRRLLYRDVNADVVAALVLTRLDYGNALLAGLPYSTVAPLQLAINTATRLVCGLRPRDHVTDATIELHWLPIRARIQYKLTVSARLSDTEQTVTKLHRRAGTSCHHKIFKPSVSRQERPACATKLTNITEVWGTGVQCCWTHSLEQSSDRH